MAFGNDAAPLESGGDGDAPAVIEIAKVRNLSPEAAARRLPVRLRGVVTFFNPVRRFAFLQDATAGIFFFPGGLDSEGRLTLHAGEEVEIEGFTRQGGYAPIVEGEGIDGAPVTAKLLGMPGLPIPVPLPWNELHNDNFHNRFVEMRGVIRAVERHAEMSGVSLEISTRGGLVQAIVPGDDSAALRKASEWINVEATLSGVFSFAPNFERERIGMLLHVQELGQITPDFKAVESAFAEPARGFATLMHFDAGRSLENRVHVEGVVTFQDREKGVYLRNADRGLWVETVQRLQVAPGDRLRVIGFPAAIERRAILRDAILRLEEHGPAPGPVTLTTEQARSGWHHADLVQIDGEVLDDAEQAGLRTLLIEADGRKFRAELARGVPENVATILKTGSWVRISGICLNDPPLPEAVLTLPSDFRVLLRTPRDIAVLREAPWWTPQRIALALGGLLSLSAATAAWGLMLRRQVARQTTIIQQKLEHEVVWEERNRIARELHDTLEQQLAAITIQLESAAARLPASPESARKSLGTMRAMIQHSRGEARRSVWDLRSHTLEQQGLFVALQELGATLDEPGEREIVVSMTGAVSRLDRQIEFHMLRIAQEAMTNAVKHGAAKRIDVTVHYEEDSVRLVVDDNGRGFDPDQPPAHGTHFGLLGMRERAAKVNGVLTIESKPSAGVTVCLTVRVKDRLVEATAR